VKYLTLFVLAVVLLPGAVAFPQDRKEATIDDAVKLVTAKDLEEWATYLASDDLEGRNAGSPGEIKAVEYIVKVYDDAGLKPVGDKDEQDKPTYFQAIQVGKTKSWNTVAFLEGSDPKLKEEVIVIGGHHDHVGTSTNPHWGQLGGATRDDKIWNGADDNASGTCTVMAVAKAFGKSGLKPKRSILFMTFTAEEGGLNGSRWYVSRPLFPLERHVAMMNLDMVGRNPDKPVSVHGFGYEDGDAWEKAFEDAVKKTGLKARAFPGAKLGGGDSDHSSFRAKSIPIIFFFTGLHADYHRVSDHPEKLSYENMEKVGRTAMYLLWSWANGEKPKWADPDRPQRK
jgi:Zn-dependent M28 family amino/carboxypeptidase